MNSHPKFTEGDGSLAGSPSQASDPLSEEPLGKVQEEQMSNSAPELPGEEVSVPGDDDYFYFDEA